uniref:Uncharacterized protein n=1 Tax=Romanomermis culicivorax TaxID=13658 RepID=A0A915JDZ7_ROMCU
MQVNKTGIDNGLIISWYIRVENPPTQRGPYSWKWATCQVSQVHVVLTSSGRDLLVRYKNPQVLAEKHC